MAGTRSKLWRKLGATAPVFQAVTTTAGTKDDHTITGFTITHGVNGDPAGLSVTTAELGLTRALPVLPNTTALTLGLTDYGAGLLAAIIGPDPDSTVPANTPARGRFHGRVVGIDVDDHGDARPDRRQTSLTASTWTSLIADLGKPVKAAVALPYVEDLYAALLDATKLPGHDDLIVAGTVPRTKWLAGDTIPAETLTGECMADIGVLLRMPRGQERYQAWPTNVRVYAGALLATNRTAPTLLRRQCQAPTTWSVPVTVPQGVAWSYYDPTGVHRSDFVIPDGLGIATWPHMETVNLDDLVINDSFNIADVMLARVRRTSPTRYQLNTLTVDLLHLLTTGDAADAATAGMLLRLNVGDPLKLGYDWPDEISGIVYASRITERVTPDTWTLALDIHTAEQISGVASPPVGGNTWDTAWAQGTTWDTIPAEQTWDTI